MSIPCIEKKKGNMVYPPGGWFLPITKKRLANNQQVVAQLAKDPAPHEAERSYVRHIPSLTTSHSFSLCMWIGGFAYAPRV